MFNMEIFIIFYFLKAVFDTSFRLLQLFLGKWNWFVNMVNVIPGWNLQGLDFVYIIYVPFAQTVNQPVFPCK